MRLVLTDAGPRLDVGDPELRLTGAQRRALAFDREVVVTAGAGAGKTHTLSLRYVATLLHLAHQAVLAGERADVEAVLVVTFTEKAAEEMAERCYRRLLELSAAVADARAPLDGRYGEGHGRRLAAAVDNLLERFDRARITTFHGFCARVLQEFPAETAAPPGFEVLDAEEAAEVYDDAVQVAVEAALRGEHAQPLLASFGSHRELTRALLAIVAERGALLPRLRDHANGRVRVEDLLATSPISPGEARVWLDRVGHPALSELARLVAPSGGGTVFRRDVRPLVGQPIPDDDLGVLGQYLRALDCLLNARGNLRSLVHETVRAPGRRWPPGTWRQARPGLEALAEGCADWPIRATKARGAPSRADRTLLDLLHRLSAVALDAIDAVQAGLERRGALDFTELQRRAVEAVCSRPELAATLARRHRYLMVDEFQDTDRAQWDLVRALGRPDGVPADRIFVVGDAKQSIYRFRGGDVTVFRAAADELGADPVVLPDNFRSRSGLISWFNAFFGQVLGPPSPDRPAWEAAYQPLTAGRADAAGGTVTLITHATKGAAEGALAEAEAIARLIGGEMLPGGGVYREAQLADRAAHPAPPIAVLLRARTHLRIYEEALERHGVPFLVAKGVGFWTRPEVVDLVNLLHGVATGEPLSVVGALRSPWLGLPDQHVFDLHGGEWSTPGALRDLGGADVDDEAPDGVRHAHAVLRRLRTLRDRVPVADLLREAVALTAAEHELAMADPSGQARANVERLIEIAARLDRRGTMLTTEIAEHFLARVDADARASEAPVAPSAARVVVMTVHAAKGLEFPVVVVPGLATLPPTRRGPLVIGRTEGRSDAPWELATTVLDPDARVRRPTRPGLLVRIDDAHTREEHAESLRLLYVAATRARDHLVLIGSTETGDDDALAPWQPAERRWMDLVLPSAERGDGLVVRPIEDVLGLEPGAGTRTVQAAPPPVDALDSLAAIEVAPRIEISPSSLDLFVRDPDAWYPRHVLGIPEADPPQLARRQSLAGARGDVIHSLLEDGLADDPAAARRRWAARAYAEGATQGEVAAMLPTLLAHLERTAADPRITARLEAPGHAELSFAIPAGEIVLRGQIDRLWFDAERDTWVVLDWKSERIDDDVHAAAERHARQLLAYAWAASRVLAARGLGPVRHAELYFTAVGELVQLGPFTDEDLAGFDALLAEVAARAVGPWVPSSPGLLGSVTLEASPEPDLWPDPVEPGTSSLPDALPWTELVPPGEPDERDLPHEALDELAAWLADDPPLDPEEPMPLPDPALPPEPLGTWNRRPTRCDPLPDELPPEPGTSTPAAEAAEPDHAAGPDRAAEPEPVPAPEPVLTPDPEPTPPARPPHRRSKRRRPEADPRQLPLFGGSEPTSQD